MLFRLPIVKFFNRILNRITVTVVLVALQLAWLAWVFFALTTGTARVWVTGVLNGLSLLIILYLVRKDEKTAPIRWVGSPSSGCCRCWAGHCIWPLATSAPPAACAAKCRRWSRHTAQTAPSSPDRPPGCAMKTGA